MSTQPTSRFDALPLFGLVIAAVAMFLAIVVARCPVLAPPGLTVGNAVSPDRTMEFIAVGIGADVPLILFYTWFAHYAFRGRRPSSPAGRDLTPATPAADHDGHPSARP